MPLQWTDDLTIGIEKIDAQHRTLIEKFNQFIDACHRHEAREMIPELINFLENYIREHFADEERCMMRENYPRLEEHKQLHREFVDKVTGLRQQLAEEGTSMSLVINLNETLLRWFINHIKRVDKELGEFMHSRDS